MFCPKCGTKALDGAGFCQNCGAKLITQPTVDAATDSTQRSGNVPADVTKKKKSKKLLIIAAIVVAFIAILIAANANDLEERGEQAKKNEEYIARQQFASANLSEVYTNEDEGISFKYPKAWSPVNSNQYSDLINSVQTPLVVLADENGSSPENYSYILVSKVEAAQEDIEYLYGDDKKFAEVFENDIGTMSGDDLEISDTSVIELDNVPARIMTAASGDIKFQVYFYAVNSNIYRVEFCWQEDSSGDKQKIFDAIMDSYTITAKQKEDVDGKSSLDSNSNESSYNGVSLGLCYRGVPVDELLGTSYENFVSIFGEPDSTLDNGEEITYGNAKVYFDSYSQNIPYLTYIGSPDLSDFTYNGQPLQDNQDELTQLIGREPDEDRLYPAHHDMMYTWDHLGSKAFLVISVPLTDDPSAAASVSVSWWDNTSESNPDNSMGYAEDDSLSTNAGAKGTPAGTANEGIAKPGSTIHFDTDFYSLEFPEYWADLCTYSQWNIEPYSYGITFYENQSYNDFDGNAGTLFSLALYANDEYYDFPEYLYLGEITVIRLATYDIVAIFPTDVQFSEAGQENYLRLSKDIADILASFTPQPDLECEYIPAA